MGRKRVNGDNDNGKANVTDKKNKPEVPRFLLSSCHKPHFNPETQGTPYFPAQELMFDNAESELGGTVGIAPEVVELCEHFHVEDVYTHELHHLLKRRNDTASRDIAYLWAKMEAASNPQKALALHMEVMEEEADQQKKLEQAACGMPARFPTNPGRALWAKTSSEEKKERVKSDADFVDEHTWDPQFIRLISEFGLDTQATQSLAKILMPFPPGRRHAYYMELRSHLEASPGRTSATAMRCLPRIKAGASLGPPPSSYKKRKLADQEKEAQQEKERKRLKAAHASKVAQAFSTENQWTPYDIPDPEESPANIFDGGAQGVLNKEEYESALQSRAELSMLAASNKVDDQVDHIRAAQIATMKETWDPQVNYLKSKFDLNDEALIGIAESMTEHDEETREDYYIDLALHLEACPRPNGTVHRLLATIREGEDLGDVVEEEDDMEIGHFQMKFELSDQATDDLAEAVARHEPAARQSYYVTLEQHLEESEHPSSTISALVAAIKRSEAITRDTLDRYR